MKDLDIIFWGSVISFIINGVVSLAVVSATTTIESLLQILAVIIVLIIFTTRVILPKFQTQTPRLAYFFEFIPLSLFVYLLVFSTGGLASPFLILTHLFAIGMAFLITPKVSIFYVILTILFIITNTYSDTSSQALVRESPFAVFLYLLAYIATVPFSQYIAKIYQQKEAWVSELSQMLATSKKQEENLLKNIEDAVLVLSKDLTISFANRAVKEKTGFGETELLEKNLFKIFMFKDDSGKNIEPEKLPLTAVINTKNELQIDKIQIKNKRGDFLRVNLKISPVIDHNGQVLGLIMIIKEFSEKDSTLQTYFNKVSQKLTRVPLENLKTIAQDLLLMLKLESQEFEEVSSFINFSQIVENEIYNLEGKAKKKNVQITSPALATKPLMPKEKVFGPEKRGSFPTVYILASGKLLEKAIQNVLKIALALAPKNTSLNVDVLTASDVVRLEILVECQLPQEKLNLLFRKFFNEFIGIENLTNCTGLEIAISENIFEKHGGSLKIERDEKGVIFQSTLIRPELGTQSS